MSIFIVFGLIHALSSTPGEIRLNELEYFEVPGLNVMAFQDFYPDGHQGGVTIVQNGERVAANGDLRLEPAPGQWSPIPKMGRRIVDWDNNEIKVELWYPDSSKNRKGFNPIIYPDLTFKYWVRVRAEQNRFKVSVDLEQPLPEEWYGKVGFNIELFPGFYFGKTYRLDDQFGIFPRQVNGPVHYDEEGKIQIKPLARGKRLVVVPEDETEKILFQSATGEIELIDGRAEHNNGWFIVRTLVKKGTLKNAVEMEIVPSHQNDWVYSPVIHLSQVGYHPNQQKIAVIEMDKREESAPQVELVKIADNGKSHVVKAGNADLWGKFLRYNYAWFDFSDIRESGMYKLKVGAIESNPFQISELVFERHVWQPTLEYFLPVQMCHMRVNDRYKVWHGLCHNDDALMAPTNHNHFDGYIQGPSTLTKYQPYEPVPGLNVGGWHDAGDYDLRIESQAETVRRLSQIYELFGVQYDGTTVDQASKVVEIFRPDGKPDVLQQIEHGALSIVGAYKSLGRFYRGIICSQLRQYTLLGDGSTMTDNIKYQPGLTMDDRWVFTEENPRRELHAAACLAAAARVVGEFNAGLADDCLKIARSKFNEYRDSGEQGLYDLAAELLQTTEESQYGEFLVAHQDALMENVKKNAVVLAKVKDYIQSPTFRQATQDALTTYAGEVAGLVKETPFGVMYRPNIWGAGWGIQEFGVEQFFLHKAYPDLFLAEPVLNALNFVLGVHPGTNTASFVSGVGANSLTVAYGVNRDEWSYIPGGSASGTALIRPDLPELKTWPYFWQQTEYVMGGGATNFMFLVLAAQHLLN